MKRLGVLTASLAMIVAGCSAELGRTVPACDDPGATLILEIQSVPGAEFVPCVESLHPEWQYRDMEANSRGASFEIDSDRLGYPFLTVEMVSRCDPGHLPRSPSDEPGAILFRDIAESTSVPVVVVPEGQAEATAARAVEIVAELATLVVAGRTLDVEVDASVRSTVERIAAARRDGAHVITVDLRNAEERTLGMYLAGEDFEQQLLSVDDAVDEIEDVTSPPTYTGQWMYVFDGGCAVYDFAASGAGVATIESDVRNALGLVAVEPLRAEFRDAGFELP